MYQFFEDPGHGWLKVTIQELIELKIEKKISSYSYKRGKFAYLEEDCDLTIFVAAKYNDPIKKHTFFQTNVNINFTNKRSKLRNYLAYSF